MNDKQNEVLLPVTREDGEEVSVIDVMIMLAKNKKLIMGVPLAAAVIALGLSFVIAPVYRATATILPPQQSQGGGAALLAQLGGAGGLVAGAAGIKNPNDMYIGLLQSRRVGDALIKQFDLMKAYDTESFEKARKTLGMNTSIVSGKDTLITITVEDGDKQRVAGIANAYVGELTKLTQLLAVTEAGQRRLFYEKQLDQAKNNLTAAEFELKKALDTRGVISVDSASRALVETTARLRAQVSAKEIQFNALKAFVTPNNQEYKVVQEELSSLRNELGKLENGREGVPGKNTGQAGIENMKLLRDVKYNQALYELLSKQYELARLDEAHDAPVVQILDAATPPEKKTRPQPLLLAIAAAAIALFLAMAFVFSREMKERVLHRGPAQGKWLELRSLLRFKR